MLRCECDMYNSLCLGPLDHARRGEGIGWFGAGAMPGSSLHPPASSTPAGPATFEEYSKSMSASQKTVKARPKHLNLMQIRLPLPGWVSIMHRVSGAVLFLAIPVLMWLLDMSLTTEIGYDALREFLAQGWVRLVLAALLWAYLHHFCAGIRYLALDLHKGVDLASARMSALVVYLVSIPLAAILCWMLLV